MATVIITGASGFLGAHYAAHALARHPEWTVVGQLRRTPIGLAAPALRRLTCDLSRPGAAGVLADLAPEVIVHMAAAIMEGDVRRANGAMLRQVLEACRRSGAALVYISSSQVGFARLNQYARSKLEDEATIRTSGVPHVILRPAAPYGPSLPGHAPARKQSMHVLVNFIQRLPAVPVIGDGRYTRQPLHVSDLNRAIDCFIERARFDGDAFDVGGPRAYPMNEIIALLARLARRRVVRVHLPKALFQAAARVVPIFSPDVLATIDCDERVDNGPILEELGGAPLTPLTTGAADLLAPRPPRGARQRSGEASTGGAGRCTP